MKITKRQLRQIIQEATVSIDVPSWSHLSEQIDDITETLNNLAGMYNDVPQSWLLTGKNEKNVISGQIAEALEQLYWDSEKLGGVISNKLAMESRTRMGEGADYDKRQLRQIIREASRDTRVTPDTYETFAKDLRDEGFDAAVITIELDEPAPAMKTGYSTWDDGVPVLKTMKYRMGTKVPPGVYDAVSVGDGKAYVYANGLWHQILDI